MDNITFQCSFGDIRGNNVVINFEINQKPSPQPEIKDKPLPLFKNWGV